MNPFPFAFFLFHSSLCPYEDVNRRKLLNMFFLWPLTSRWCGVAEVAVLFFCLFVAISAYNCSNW